MHNRPDRPQDHEPVQPNRGDSRRPELEPAHDDDNRDEFDHNDDRPGADYNHDTEQRPE
jgi:hypothetical protein